MHDVTQSQEQWEQEWARMLEYAKTRMPMYTGSEEHAHRLFISAALKLLWQAKVFRRPVNAKIDIAPHQCIISCHAGPLQRPIQQLFSWGGGRTLAERWRGEGETYFDRLDQEDEERGKFFSRYRSRRGWRYCFSGPTGPRLADPSYPAIFAQRFLWGVRTDSGLWCESYAQGWPTGVPFLVAENSPVALLVMADLDPQRFAGLPYNEDDVQKFSAMAHHEIKMTRHRPLPDWTPGDISVSWHPQNNLVTDASLTLNGISDRL